jgi:hypothetical protein
MKLLMASPIKIDALPVCLRHLLLLCDHRSVGGGLEFKSLKNVAVDAPVAFFSQ